MTGPNIKVLIIEDDSNFVEIVRLCLEEPDSMGMRFELERADRLETGLRLLELDSYDAVLLDLMLPDSRGMDTVLALLSKAPDLPILVMTSLGDESLAFEAMRLGAQDFLVKATSDSRWLKRSIWYAMERKRLLAQTETILKKAADGMAVIDGFGAVRYLNPAGEALLGSRLDEILGRPFPYPLPSGESGQIQIKGPPGEEKVVEMRVTQLDWKGAPAKLASMRDISELRRLERLKAEIQERRKIDALKDDFIGTVSHELRTPLTLVRGAVEVLKEGVAGPLSARQENIITLAHRNAIRLSKMIHNLLDISRLESGRAGARLGRCAPLPLIKDACENFRLASRASPMVLEEDLAPDLPDVRADSDMIAQVLSNLLENAFRFAKSRVLLRASRTADDRVLIEVLDDGPGIPPDRMDDLFNKFVQVNRAAGGAGYKGTGLGLAICKEIMTLHGSTIAVESSLGAGSRFFFSLPAWAEARAEEAGRATP